MVLYEMSIIVTQSSHALTDRDLWHPLSDKKLILHIGILHQLYMKPEVQ